MRSTLKFESVGLLFIVLLCAFVPVARAQSGPFAAMEGTWSGEGSITTSAGLRERLRCRATYRSGEAGDQLRLALRCASDSYNFDLAGDVEHRNGAISGRWSEATRRVSGSISGRARGDQVDANATGDGFSATLSLSTRANRQSVRIRYVASEATEVSIALTKGGATSRRNN
jgi:hypothetical protein